MDVPEICPFGAMPTQRDAGVQVPEFSPNSERGLLLFQKQNRAHFQSAVAEGFCSSVLRACPWEDAQWADMASQAFSSHYAVYVKPTLHANFKQSPLPFLLRKQICNHMLFAGWSCCCLLGICQTQLSAVVAEGTWTLLHTSFEVQAGLWKEQEVYRHRTASGFRPSWWTLRLEVSSSCWTWILGLYFRPRRLTFEWALLHCIWWVDRFDGCTRGTMSILAHGPLAFRPCSYLTCSLNMSFLSMLDNIPPDVLGTKTPYRTGLSCPWSSAFLFAIKAVECGVKGKAEAASHCSENVYPKSGFASCLGAFTLPCSPLLVCFLLPALSPDGAAGSSLPREE